MNKINNSIRKYCEKCLIEYRIVSTSNECNKCKNKLTIEFDICIPYIHSFQDSDGYKNLNKYLNDVIRLSYSSGVS